MIRVSDWVVIDPSIENRIRPLSNYGQVVHVGRDDSPDIARYVVEVDHIRWYFYEYELEVIDPEKELGEEYFI